MIRIVIFDMAGTTIDEDNLVYKCVLKALKEHDVDTDLEVVLNFAAGKEKLDAIKHVFRHVCGSEPSETLASEIYRSFAHLLSKAYDHADISLFEGVSNSIEFLRRMDIKIVFNTGYNRETAEKLLRKVNIKVGHQIDLLVTADDVKNSRPNPDMIDLALSHFDLEANECIKIGDSRVDILEGINAKVKLSIGITTGAQLRDILAEAKPHMIIDHIEEILPIISDINNSF